jgi:hypothetical protein
LHTGFKIEPIGNGEFFGFTLDRDQLYLLGDFTVTHNSGKGYALSKSPETADLSQLAGAVWDAAGEQNATENPWVLEECRKRGIKAKFAFIHADPVDTWENPKRGVVERAGGKGRMVDAQVYADSYSIGPKNFRAFMDSHIEEPDVEFFVFDNATGGDPQQVKEIPQQAFAVDVDKLYAHTSGVMEKRKDTLKPAIYRGGTIGSRIWGQPKKQQAPEPKFLKEWQRKKLKPPRPQD